MLVIIIELLNRISDNTTNYNTAYGNMLPSHLNGCKKLSLTSREEHKLNGSQN